MSKIQDALRKLRSESMRSSATQGVQKPPVAIATVVDSPGNDEQNGQYRSDMFVDIDFDRLREEGLLAPVDQQKLIADEYRLIKRPLLNNASGRGADQLADANLIMVASPLPREGKTFNCLNLALSMATEKDKSVVLVDADVAKPHISSLFGLEAEPGLIDLLTDSSRDVKEFLLKTNVPGLFLLPAGRFDEHATELLASRRMAAVVDSLSKTFPDRIVIFDSPPLMVTSEARVLASRMGQIVLVVRSGVTPQKSVVASLDSLDQNKAISLVLNQASRGLGSETYGGYGYGYGGVGYRRQIVDEV